MRNGAKKTEDNDSDSTEAMKKGKQTKKRKKDNCPSVEISKFFNPTPNDDKNSDWACMHCTFINSGLAPICNICRRLRVDSSSDSIVENNNHLF